MTEKERFHFGYVCGDTGLIDEQAEHQWFIENCCSITDLKKNWKAVCDKLNEVNEENKELKKELFQSEKEYLYEAYAGNSVRRDNKIKALEDEFNERFGDDWK